MARLGIALVIAGLVIGSSQQAHAAAPKDGFHKAGFVYLSPGLFYIPIGDDDTRDAFDIGYQWGVGGGYMYRRDAFMLTAGGAFEHLVANFDDCDRDNCKGGMLRLLPELRIGGGTQRIFGYGRVAPGLAYSFAEVDVAGFSAEDDDIGFNLGLGGGVQGIVWSNLAVGGELNVDLAFFDADDVVDDIHTIAIKAFVAWYF